MLEPKDLPFLCQTITKCLLHVRIWVELRDTEASDLAPALRDPTQQGFTRPHQASLSLTRASPGLTDTSPGLTITSLGHTIPSPSSPPPHEDIPTSHQASSGLTNISVGLTRPHCVVEASLPLQPPLLCPQALCFSHSALSAAQGAHALPTTSEAWSVPFPPLGRPTSLCS